MRVLFISGERPTYTRNAILLKGLQDNKVDVIDCSDLSSFYGLRYPRALIKYLKSNPSYDVMIVGFFGQPLVTLMKKMTGKPIVFDAFLSGYDTMCYERKKVSPTSLGGRFFYWLDKNACRNADKIILDTSAHIQYFVETFGVDERKFERVFVGADDAVFYPLETPENGFKVFYYGTFRPLQGIEYIVRAAKHLEALNIQIEIVGTGPEHPKIMKIAKRLKSSNITFVDWVPYERLPLKIAEADICLGGHFSNIDKAKRVIAGKTFQFAAMKKPLILGDNPANRELFDGESALFVEHADAEGLADAIIQLHADEALRKKLADNAHSCFKKECTPRILGAKVKDICQEVLDSTGMD